MGSGSNASGIQAGFHYQDFVALYVFLKHIEEIEGVNDEGDEDIEIIYKNGEHSFLQAKESKFTDKIIPSTVLKKALKSLVKDHNEKSNIRKLVIVTNSNKPFGKNTQGEFASPYMAVDFNSLNANSRKRINDYLKEILEDKTENELMKYKNKLLITKIQYSGYDEESRLQLLNQQITDFMSKADIPTSNHRFLKDEWIVLFSQSTEDKTEISLKQFIAHTEAVILDFPNLDKFFEELEIEYQNEGYVEQGYQKYLKFLAGNYLIISKIRKAFSEYRQLNLNLGRSELRKRFINEWAPKFLNEFDFPEGNKNIDIVKLVLWLVIRKDSMLNSIERVVKLDN
ncbi:dsDNA nuclease domain-containing protein [Limosilactobacillus reuteri]|uniref:dsDNA nuclease domain-containing protein n=1 Tax=Limosilactobacillus reuteri TaxID=1598 RepID=UPI001E64162A|nr:dsDNA nuclease domain-containing protein [Limosilactobacillus reuteri]MCC4357473.1 dsDNA nuclease domain-containing protein [Limosilactobacillus reuteri]MCC4361918.1 dsDNA nuclease domain-containing protein [Limosilactobacillus reuteri]MCC4363693.1 dsDNA nuclease domain-containing protein [Limosilactobacillus reuteri]